MKRNPDREHRVAEILLNYRTICQRIYKQFPAPDQVNTRTAFYRTETALATDRMYHVFRPDWTPAPPKEPTA